MTADPLIGRQLSTFLIKRVLGRGGMAQVYFGQDVKLQRPVAVKVIDVRHRDKPSYAQRFLKEARAMAGWRHENIVQVYFADDQDGFYYYVMEYIDGQDLAGLMASYSVKGKFMPNEEILRIGRAVANALDYAHSKGFIHRDVKPSNVLLSKDGRVVLSDFGLALDTHEGSRGEAFGTPHYVAPEQSRRSTDAVPQSDLYALGVILYEMLTGSVPFDDESPTTVALQHITEPPPPPRSLNPQLNAETESVLLKVLSKKPQNRYQTGAELMDALAKALAKPHSAVSRILPLPPMPATILAGKNRTLSQRKGSVVVDESAPRRRWPLFWGIFVLILVVAFILGNVLLPGGFASLPFFAPPTATPAPAATLTQVQPAPVLPSATFTPTDTLTPAPPPATATQPPKPTTTATLAPASDKTSAPSPTTTQEYPNYKRLWLYYDSFGFYIYNASDTNRSISPISFERLNKAGKVSNRFQGALWAEFYPTLNMAGCMRIEIQKNPQKYLNPSICRKIYLSTRSITSDSDYIFWTPTANSTRFRVLWKIENVPTEMGICDANAGFCEVFVP